MEIKHKTSIDTVSELTEALAGLSEELQELKDKMDTKGDVVRKHNNSERARRIKTLCPRYFGTFWSIAPTKQLDCKERAPKSELSHILLPRNNNTV